MELSSSLVFKPHPTFSSFLLLLHYHHLRLLILLHSIEQRVKTT